MCQERFMIYFDIVLIMTTNECCAELPLLGGLRRAPHDGELSSPHDDTPRKQIAIYNIYSMPLPASDVPSLLDNKCAWGCITWAMKTTKERRPLRSVPGCEGRLVRC